MEEDMPDVDLARDLKLLEERTASYEVEAYILVAVGSNEMGNQLDGIWAGSRSTVDRLKSFLRED